MRWGPTSFLDPKFMVMPRAWDKELRTLADSNRKQYGDALWGNEWFN